MAAMVRRWLPWPSAKSRKCEVRMVVRRIEGLPEAGAKAVAEVKWKGPKTALNSLRRGGVRRDQTREEDVREGGGVVVWDQEFLTACTLTAHKGGDGFLPWEIAITVFSGLSEVTKKKDAVVGVASLNLAEFASTVDGKELEIIVPLSPISATSHSHLTLELTLCLLELRNVPESVEVLQSFVVPVPLSPPTCDAFPSEKDESSSLKAGLIKVNALKALLLFRKSKKACQIGYVSEENSSPRNIDRGPEYPYDSDSFDEDHEDAQSIMNDSGERNSFGYGNLTSVNCIGGSFSIDMVDNQDMVYYSHQKSDTSYSCADDTKMFASEQLTYYFFKRSILSWKKNGLSFKTRKTKEEPLLKKANAAEGGDDIDFDRRQLSSLGDSTFMLDCNCTSGSSVSNFGDDDFVVGSWEPKEIFSRDGHLKLITQVFFASIDQRSEKASGEAACAVLVTIFADWFHANPDMMPIKSQLDQLIREGSSDWRILCENDTYRERFHDRHFDIETVLEAKIRHLSIVPAKSFVGFFHPEAEVIEDSETLNFLKETKSFDDIWDEISCARSESSSGGPHLYIISWNDHFFILKVEHDAYYIIDTLGERLHEGCNQAYILKFDDTTTIHKVKSEVQSASDNAQQESNIGSTDSEDELICHGKESCKDYIKSFLAAIPIRQLQSDLRKRPATSTQIHQRLQIDFHYTKRSKEQTAEPQRELTLDFLYSPQSESELSSPTESETEPSGRRETATKFSWEIVSSELSWPTEPEQAFLLTPSVNLEVEVA
ncbi:uncharacterized protein LOC122041738 [Zingiber officinale]|uniref:C2 NT-type domain-containing protein n=1 Tax=Zingiber officinale TaxID=94328 RepID=A0A8J5LPJ1_ZINOF|nr:uncharacterized protein LOC122041738 [Zingiber officinale]KAG6528545.1 hypothetical protein ZIOFF_010723 [Zingiber officinale]